MKINVVAIRIWLITFGITLLSFVFTTVFYGVFYSQEIKENYMDEYEQIIENVERLATADPHFLLENIEPINNFHSQVNFALLLEDTYTPNDDEWVLPFDEQEQEMIAEEPGIMDVIDSSESVKMRSDQNDEYDATIPYVFHIQPTVIDGEDALLYSWADLSFLVTLERRISYLLTGLVLAHIFAAVYYYIYLKRNVSEPINAMTNIAFDFARDDFSHQLPISGRDDLSELAMAMNKMGHSLETNRMVVKQEKELLSHILDNIETGIIYYDSDKTLLLSNPVGDLFLTHYQIEESNFSDQDEFVDIEAKLDEVIQEKASVEFTIEMEETYYVVTVLPLLESESQDLRGLVVSTKDLTKEHRLDRMRVDFINNISHELRTPLVMVQGYSEAILDDVAESIEEKKEMAQIIRDESQRMNRMVNEMLDLSRMEAGYIELQKTEVNMNSYLRNLLFRFDNMASDVEVSLQMEAPKETIHQMLDKDKMDQVFVNLINNAIRHTSMTEKSEKIVTLQLLKEEELDEVVMIVKDTGTGIPEDDLPYIFDRFFKADKSRNNYSSNAKGTGIGLSLVKNIIEAHGGFIEVESTFGEGSAFIIHIPMSDEEDDSEE
ncbi:ATP-binding protein [Alkalibacterium putridalgicola]|uniref:histidine kinase n=1 Tax=Alkalibacterium putridalgicola TaxID=426703 RepID=A0A1H7Q100_9LACT|nr:ATP-binding protein [Alkalibacterium putridalgicola]GEK88086.1 two-component sensor histidine kinase [Alkalibacterium putridalgicola]SEL41394.1 two-component system, OmpR family, sensor histidine kinase ResE [Alkalibacterium putridalgicola]